jgi:hypothetical protein
MSSRLDNANDIDWFKVSASDGSNITCETNPAVASTVTTVPLQVCLYAVPVSASTTWTCPAGSTTVTSPFNGCCSFGPGPAFAFGSYGAAFQDDSAELYVSVSELDPTETCKNYTVKINF